jgi:hypothetical protein
MGGAFGGMKRSGSQLGTGVSRSMGELELGREAYLLRQNIVDVMRRSLVGCK